MPSYADLQARIDALRATTSEYITRLEKAAPSGRKRIPGDGDGDGIPNEGRKPKGGASSGGFPAKPKLKNDGHPSKKLQDDALDGIDRAIRSGNVKSLRNGIQDAEQKVARFEALRAIPRTRATTRRCWRKPHLTGARLRATASQA